MQKKSLSRLGLIVFVVFSNISACSISLPNIQTSNDNKGSVKNSTSNGTQGVGASTNNTSSSNQVDNSSLTNKASDANPVDANTTTVSSPVPSTLNSNTTSSPTPTPSASVSSTSGTSGSGQLNILINPNMPTKRVSP